MGFQVTLQDDIVVFTCGESFTANDFQQFLGILDKLLAKKEPFVFIVDARKSVHIPIRAGLTLIKWMKQNKPIIPGILVGTGVIFKNPKISALLNWAFQKQKPISPNLITTKEEDAYNFVRPIIEETKLKRQN
jgi:hypothetical protein